MTVVETGQFQREANGLMTESERLELIAYVANNPESGDIMPETGGVRKLRWAAMGKGKRGGVRVIYYYRNERLPLFLLDMYAKNVKANLTRAERNAMKKRIPILVEQYERRRPL
jgi:hypothetical protein